MSSRSFLVVAVASLAGCNLVGGLEAEYKERPAIAAKPSTGGGAGSKGGSAGTGGGAGASAGAGGAAAPADGGPPDGAPDDAGEDASHDASGGSGGSGGGGGAGGGSAGSGPGLPLGVECTPVANGQGAVSLYGSPARPYYVDLPTDVSKPMALMFSWHGLGQESLAFKNNVGFDPNGASMPIVIVTPTDVGLVLTQLPVLGHGWDIQGSLSNIDVPYFLGMLACLENQLNIDPSRVYSFGFSAGAIFNNLLASERPQLFAAIVSESGAWFNDTPEQTAVFGLGLLFPWNWPALDPADRGSVLITHGGGTDVANAIISMEVTASNALPFLLKAKRTVVDCPHTSGHAIDPLLKNKAIYEYFLAHQLGKPSLFEGGVGLPADLLEAGCSLHAPM